MMLYVKPKFHGVVFFTVLIFFQLITVIGLYLLQTNFISKKMNDAYWQHYDLFRIANERLRFIESTDLFELEACHMDVMTQVNLLSKSFNWWQDHACAENIAEISYYYVIESLNNTSCIKLNNHSLEPITYFRITLLAYSKNKVFREILQSVVIKLDNVMRDCVDGNDVYLGRQSLRRL